MKPSHYRMRDDEDYGDEPNVESLRETSEIAMINDTFQVASFTSEEREAWIASQCSEPEDQNFYSKSINLIDFKVESVVGHGSFSKVYLVRKRDTGNYN